MLEGEKEALKIGSYRATTIIIVVQRQACCFMLCVLPSSWWERIIPNSARYRRLASLAQETGAGESGAKRLAGPDFFKMVL
jgi:hypothetical protein